MNRIAILAPILGLGLATLVGAQTPSANVAQPTSPAPAVATTPPPTVVQSPVPTEASVPVPAGTQIVYAPQLPTAVVLTKAAADQGWAVDRIVQTSTQIIAFYRNASGQPITVAYQSMPPTGAAPASASAPVVMTPAPTVVYMTPPPVVYEPFPAYYRSDYYPGYWYPPVSLSFGFGFRSYHGGFRHR